MIRARLQRNNKEYTLGEFQTKKEVGAAKVAAARVLDRVEADKPVPIKRKPTAPSLALVGRLSDMGVYDRNAESIMVLIRKLKRRHDMVTDGVLSDTPPIQTLTLDEIVDIYGGVSIREGRGPLLPQNRW